MTPVAGAAASRPPDPSGRRLAAGLLAVLLAGLLLGACATDGAPHAAARGAVRPGGPRQLYPLAPGQAVPDFVAPGLGGGLVRWRDRDGSPAALVVWASWCPHCRRLLPELARVGRSYPTIRLVTVTTSIGRRPGPSPAEFLADRGLAFPVALDDVGNVLARALGVYRYPTVYWVRRDGTVRTVTEGEVGEARLRDLFEALAAGAS